MSQNISCGTTDLCNRYLHYSQHTPYSILNKLGVPVWPGRMTLPMMVMYNIYMLALSWDRDTLYTLIQVTLWPLLSHNSLLAGSCTKTSKLCCSFTHRHVPPCATNSHFTTDKRNSVPLPRNLAQPNVGPAWRQKHRSRNAYCNGVEPSNLEGRHLVNNREAAIWKMAVGANYCCLNALQRFWVLNNWHPWNAFHIRHILPQATMFSRRNKWCGQTKHSFEFSHVAHTL